MARQAERLPAQRSGTFLLGGDLPVVRLGYGAMQLTGPGVWGEPRDRGEARAVLRRAVELGVNFIDTADSYGPYVSEEIIAEALHPYGDSLVIATKAGLVRTGPGEWHPVGRPEYLRQEVEMSLRRLRLDRIDLLQLHRIDPQVPLPDQIGVLADLKNEGKIRHIGVSEVSVEEIEQVRKIAEIVSVQNLYNLANRQSEAVLDYAEREGLGFIPWFPIATGELAKPGGPLAGAAKDHGVSPAQLALAWLLRRSPVMLPIPGTSRVAHLEENVAAAEVDLTDDEYDVLAKAV
ncbi:aldo/keto reductase [Microtetraspora sp. AC03309]|uniref:aldo/keto reductase n=1 Tax=Microtetraspora sp. AC03309 TaxID=2779376 RepID=UPI001E421990|nr:aldo/keto reductase [Microtetraspora sp. AC03309]MCC5574428.1 aldo/keto reductase [Microtetraspora sp. AC03309]